MDVKAMVAFVDAASNVSRAIKNSAEGLEPFLYDETIEIYYESLKVVQEDLDASIYACEQSISEATSQGFH